MAEFEKVRGQIEGLWNTEVKNAELEGRKAGAAAAVEAVWQAGERIAGEWDEERAPRRTHKGFLHELKQSVGGLPALQLTPEEWERVHEALAREPGLRPEATGVVDGERMTFAEWNARMRERFEGVADRSPFNEADARATQRGIDSGALPGADDRPGFRVGDIAAPLPGSVQAQAAPGEPYADWQERGVAPVQPEEVTHQADWSATGEALRQADLEREADAEKEAHRLADLPPAERSAL